MKPISYLLDTHAWIWFITGNSELSKIAQKTINQATQEHQLYLAAISLWELAMLENRKRITLGMPRLEWINQSLKLANIDILPINPAIAVESCQLPDGFHEDPADRLIVATARVHDLTLITRDSRILDYGKKKYVMCLKA